MLVLLYYIVFAGAPGLIGAINWIGATLRDAGIVPGIGDSLANMNVRTIDFTVRVVLALCIGYSAPGRDLPLASSPSSAARWRPPARWA
ncbi:MAG: hypothetical protein R2844_06785 [Caldilineales bacterium]